MSSWLKLDGTQSGKFGLGLSGVELKNNNGNLDVRTNGDTAYANIRVNNANVDGNLTVANLTVTGNVTTANLSGDGGKLSNITGANVTGNVPNASNAANANVANTATTAGTVTTNAQPNITSVGTLTSLSVSGDLSTNGTNTFVNSQNTFIQSPLINLGDSANGGDLLSNDGKDRGEILHYYTTETQNAFMGWDNSNGEFAFGNSVSVTDDVVTFNTFGNVRAYTFIGELHGTASAATVADSANAVAGANVTGSVANATLAATANTVAGANVTGTVANATFATSAESANTANTSTTVTANAQPNITSVGTLTSLTSSGTVLANSLSSNTLSVTANTEIGGELTVSGNATVLADLHVTGNINFTGNVTQISGNSGQFFGDANGVGALYAGLSTGYSAIPNTIIQASGSVNSYAQINFQNKNGGNISSTEYVATADNGSDSVNYLDVGIAGGNWDGTQENSIGTAAGPDDGWMYVQGGTGGGNLILGTTSANTEIKFLSGGPNAANVVANLSAEGLKLTGNVTSLNANLGNLATANFFSGDGHLLTNLTIAAGSAIVNGNSNVSVAPNANVTIGVNGTAAVVTISDTGTNVIGTFNATGNANVGNLVTSTLTVATDIFAAGNATIANLFVLNSANVAGSVNATRNLNANGNASISGAISAIGNISGGNLVTGGKIIATGNITGGNLVTAGDVVANGNVTAGNIAGGNVVTANFFSGDGHLLSNLTIGNSIVNGSSNVTVEANSNVTFGIDGVDSVLVVASSGLAVTGAVGIGGALGVTGNATIANISTGTMAATGNITGGNITTAGIVTATGNITGGNITTAGIVTATGNVSGGNITTAGNVSGGNITTAGIVTATGNVSGGNITTAGEMSANGNITAANITGGNLVSANFFSGDGHLLTNLTIAGSIANGNSNVSIATSNGDIKFYSSGKSALTISGNSLFTNSDLDVSGRTIVSAVGNLIIPGGNSGQFLSTNGNGALRWATVSSTSLANGTSNIIIEQNGNVNISSDGTDNVFVVTSTGAAITGAVGIGGALGVTGLITGNGGGLSNIVGANVTGQVPFANVANSVAAANVTGQVANALVAATVYSNAQPNITSVGTLSNLSVTGSVGLGDTVVSGNATITGNLTVNGNTNYVQTNSLYVVDPIIQQGGGANGAPLTNNDGKDRGSLLHYYTTTPVDAFMGWDSSNSEFAFGSNVTDINDVIVFNSLGNVRASTFIGSLSGTVTTAAQPNITSVGTLTSLGVNGAVTASTFASNVATGTAPFTVTSTTVVNNLRAMYADTVLTAAQPNITSVGTLANLTVSGTTNLGAIGNLTITGGSNTQFLQTDGTGNLSWANVKNVDTSKISNGNSNVSIASANGDIKFYSAGLTALTISGNALFTSADLDISGRTIVSNVGNLIIPGGANGQVLSTNGNGVLSWSTVASGGVATALNSNIGNTHINGGLNGQVLKTDGTGNLSWYALPSGSETFNAFLLAGM